MVLALTCALCVAVPDAMPVERTGLLDTELSLGRVASGSSERVPLAMGHLLDQGSGEGDHDQSHQDHMGPMWILMGAMMVVMMVGMGVYLMRHSATGQVVAHASPVSPAQLAIPVSGARPGGG